MSAEAVNVGRRGHGVARALGVAVALAVVVTGLLFESLVGGKVLTQADALNLFEPWKSAAGPEFRASNPVLLDQATGFLPWLDFAAQEFRRGELPLWQPHNYGGIPLVGTCQSAIYWPLSFVYYVWPSWHAHAVIAAILLWLAGLGMFAWLVRLGCGTGAALCGGVAFVLCGFMVAWLNHPHARVAMCLPWLLWTIERMAARPGSRAAALFGALVGVQLLAGHVQTSLHVALFVVTYALFRMPVPVQGVRLPWRGLVWLGVGAVLGLALGTPQILPFLEYLGHSQAATQFQRADMVASVDVADAAVLMVAPAFHGGPHTHDYTGPLGTNLNYNELIGGYVGRVVLLLAALQVAWLGWRAGRRGLTAFFALALAFACLVAWQVEPLHSLVRAVPQLGSTKLMRFSLFVALALIVLGAFGLDALARRFARPGLAHTLAFASIAVELLWFARGYNPQVDAATLLPRTQVVEFLQRETGDHRVLGLDNTFLKPNANVFHRIPMLSGYDSMEDRRFAELVLRMTSRPPEFPFVSQIGAFDRFESLPLASLLGVRFLASPGLLPPPLREALVAEVRLYENPAAMPKAFLAREVRVIEDSEERLAFLSSASFDPRIAVLEADSPARELLTRDPDGAESAWARTLGAPLRPDADSVSIVRVLPREILVEVATTKRALLVSNDVWEGGWRAEILAQGGRASLPVPIERVDHALRGVFLEPGSWVVRFRYDPWSTWIGLWLAAMALVGLGWCALRRGAAHDPAVESAP